MLDVDADHGGAASDATPLLRTGLGVEQSDPMASSFPSWSAPPPFLIEASPGTLA